MHRCVKVCHLWENGHRPSVLNAYIPRTVFRFPALHSHLSAILCCPPFLSLIMIDLSTLEDIYQVGKKIYDVVQSIKKAPEAIRELETQILLVQSTLEELKHELEGREDAELIDGSTEPLIKMLERARQLSEKANEFLEKATTKTGNARRKVRKLKWVLCDESDAKELAEKFHMFHGSLNTVLTVVHLRLS